jgi:hypothetical protein
MVSIPSITSIGPCQLSNKREKDHWSGYTTRATELGSCLTDVTRGRVAPEEPFVCYRYVVTRTSHTTIIAAF